MNLEILAAEIRARIAKGETETRPDKAEDFKISAGYCLVEAYRAVKASGGLWPEWCAANIRRSLAFIRDLMALIDDRFKPAAPQPRPAQAPPPQPSPDWHTRPRYSTRYQHPGPFRDATHAAFAQSWFNSRSTPGNVWREVFVPVVNRGGFESWRAVVFKKKDGSWGIRNAMPGGRFSYVDNDFATRDEAMDFVFDGTVGSRRQVHAA